MKTYVISYDLNKAGQNYSCLTQKIRGYGTYCKLGGSAWLIRSAQSAVKIRDNLGGCLDTNDQLFVGLLEGEAAWTGYTTDVSNWIKELA